jgi:hypothetical protein
MVIGKTIGIAKRELNRPLYYMAFAWILVCIVFVGGVHASPNTLPVTLIGSNNATLSASGADTTGWFVWGSNSDNEYWITPNQTVTGGAFSYRIHSSPLYGNTVYYVRACDVTGCGNEVSFTTLPVTPMPTVNIGGFYTNITESGFDPLMMMYNIGGPYVWNSEVPITVVFMLIFSPLFIGVWARSRSVLVSLILGFITGSFFLYANQGLGLGMPPEIISIAQAFCYIAFAGCVVYIVHR